MNLSRNIKRHRRHARIRAKVEGTEERPRLSVFKSNRYLSAQVINDEKQKTVLGMTDKDMKGKTKTERARALGIALAKEAKDKKITKIVFDRGGFVYTGRVKAFAEALREGGLSF